MEVDEEREDDEDEELEESEEEEEEEEEKEEEEEEEQQERCRSTFLRSTSLTTNKPRVWDIVKSYHNVKKCPGTMHALLLSNPDCALLENRCR